MKLLLVGLLLLIGVSAYAANPSFQDFNTNQFSVNQNGAPPRVSLLSTGGGGVVTNYTIITNNVGTLIVSNAIFTKELVTTNVFTTNIQAFFSTNIFEVSSNIYTTNLFATNIFVTNLFADFSTNVTQYVTNLTANYITNSVEYTTNLFVFQTNVVNNEIVTNLTVVNNFDIIGTNDLTSLSNLFLSGWLDVEGPITNNNTFYGDSLTIVGSPGSSLATPFYVTDPSGTVILGGFDTNGGYTGWFGDGHGLTNLNVTGGGDQVWTNDNTAIRPVQGTPDISIVAVTNIPIATFGANFQAFDGSDPNKYASLQASDLTLNPGNGQNFEMYTYTSAGVTRPVIDMAGGTDGADYVTIDPFLDFGGSIPFLFSTIITNGPTAVTFAVQNVKTNLLTVTGNGLVTANGYLIPTNGVSSATAVDFYVQEATTNASGNVAFTSIINWDATKYNYAIRHIKPVGADRTVTVGTGWKTDNGTTTYTATNGIVLDLLFECQLNVFTNVSSKYHW